MENAASQEKVQSNTSTATLLFVDDEENILSSLKRIFRPLKYQILTASSGAKGLEILEQQHIDLIISDMRMPEMDGAEFLSQAAEKYPDTARILLTGYADMSATIAAINRGNIFKYISKPWEENDLKLTVQLALERKRLLELTHRQNEELKELNANLEKKVAERTQELRRAMGAIEKTHESLKKSYTSSIRIFSNLIDMRAQSLAGHSRRVANQARSLALQMRLTNTEVQDILFAGLLHDIGKIGLNDELINKPYEKLSPADRAIVNKHTVIGEGILMALEPLQGTARIIRAHHECFDGSGYPDHLKGAKIPLGARILSVVNDYDALLSGTLLHHKMAPERAQQYLVENSGKRYDPQIVDAFLVRVSEAGEKEKKTIIIKSRHLLSGMVLAKDLITADGVLLLSEGYLLEEKIIDKIFKLEQSLEEQFDIHVLDQ